MHDGRLPHRELQEEGRRAGEPLGRRPRSSGSARRRRPTTTSATPPVVTQGPYDGYENLVYDEKIEGYVPKSAAA